MSKHLLALAVILTVVQGPDRTPRSQGALTVPPGFVVEPVAGPPLVNRPIVADLDERGRLYVADSSGSNDRVEKQLEERPHRIVRLEDADGDGRYDKSVVFADRMMLPEGTLWFDGSLYVAAPPSIWRLTDTDDDGVADQREEWFRGETLTGCANDLHGPYLGLDGWIYWTKGAFAQQTYAQGPRPPLVTRAAHIFRRRPGTSAIEVVMTGGMDNPVDVAFTPAGERIFSATFLEHPQAGRRDALVHAIYGGVYGKPHAVLDGHIRTGDLMPVMCQLGPAVPAGLTRYASRVFGPEYRDSLFTAMFNLRKVTRHVLEPSGATFTTRDTDFLVSGDRDFHPTDVIEDADGSLLVVDTGPWYKLCCPTSQLAKPDVLGAIYRVRRRGAPRVVDPRGQAVPWRSMTPVAMARLLDDPRPVVQQRALFEFSKRGAAAVTALARVVSASPSIEARRNAVWALTRVDGDAAREAVRVALADRDDTVAAAAAHSAGLWRDRAAAPQLIQALGSRPPAGQRAAAEALGRIGDPGAIAPLLARAGAETDRVLEHSLTFALIEIGDPGELARADAGATTPRGRRSALIALDQIGRGHLSSTDIVPLLDSADPVLRDTAWWVAARHPEWGGALAPVFRRRLAQSPLDSAAREDLQQKLVPLASSSDIQQLLAETVEGAASDDARWVAIGAIGAAMAPSRGMKALPAAWSRALVHALAGGSVELTKRAVAVVRALPEAARRDGELSKTLLDVAGNAGFAAAVRLEALGALAGASPPADLFTLLLSSLGPEQPAAIRAAAAAVVEKGRFDRAQLLALTQALATAGPLELPRLLPAFDHGTDEAVGLAMVDALGRSASRAMLRADILRPRLAKYPAAVQSAGDRLLASSQSSAAAEAQRLEQMLTTLPAGDIARGQQVFNGTRAACLSCHAIGYIGGRIGPDLTRIGQVRADRDLLESVVFPNASFARGYETVTVQTRGGALLSGVLRSETPDAVVLSDMAGKETSVVRGDITDLQPATVSLMPAGFGELLSPQELADLLSFLRTLK